MTDPRPLVELREKVRLVVREAMANGISSAVPNSEIATVAANKIIALIEAANHIEGGLEKAAQSQPSAETGTHIPSSPQPRRQTGVCRVDFDDDGEHVDDVAITGDLIEMFRLEAMDRDQFWANVSMLDGRDLRFWFDGSKARSLKVTAEWEGPHTDAEPEDADGEIPE